MPTLKPRVNFWIERDGEVLLSEWRVQLLEAIQRTGSISEAARERGVDYRTAWRKVKEMEERLGTALVVRRAGGRGGGGAQLTARAADLVKRFRSVTRGLEGILARRFAKEFTRGGL